MNSAEVIIEMLQFRGLTVTNFSPKISGPADISDMRTISKDTPFGVAFPRSSDWPPLEQSMRMAKARAKAMRRIDTGE
jgi:hypothetical protein